MATRERLFASSLIDLGNRAGGPALAKRPGNASGIPRSWNTKHEPPAEISGHFSKAEDKRLMECIEEYCEHNSLTLDDVTAYLRMEDRWGEQGKLRDAGIKGMWVVVAEAFPKRSVQSVFRRGERLLVHHSDGIDNAWTAEDIRELETMVQSLGRRWVKIGHALKRHPTACRDKYSDLEKGKSMEELIGGRFTPEEIKRLVHLVRKYTAKAARRRKRRREEDEDDESERGRTENEKGRTEHEMLFPTSGIPWGKIAKKMGRSVSSLMKKWYFDVHRQVSGFGREEWGDPEDDALLQAIVETGAEDADEVPWNALPLRTTAATAKQRWLQLAKTVARSHLMSFEQIVQALDARMRARLRSANPDSDDDGEGDVDDDALKRYSDVNHDYAHGRWWPSTGGGGTMQEQHISANQHRNKSDVQEGSDSDSDSDSDADASIAQVGSSDKRQRRVKRVRRESVSEDGSEGEGGGGNESDVSLLSTDDEDLDSTTERIKQMAKRKVKMEEEARAAVEREREAIEAKEHARVKAERRQQKLQRKEYRKERRAAREKRRKLREGLSK